jgi:WD40 repeat protein
VASRRLAPGFRIGSSFQARFSSDGSLLATLGKRVTLWDVAGRRRIATGPPLAHASSVDFSPDAPLLAAKNTSGDILILGLPDLTERARFSGAGFGEGPGLLFAPDGEQFVEATWSGLLTVRAVATGTVQWQEQGDAIYSLATTRDRRLFVYTRSDHAQVGQRVFLRSWPFDGAPQPLGSFHDVHALAISDDGTRVAIASDTLLIVERSADGAWPTVARGTQLPHGGTGQALSWSPDGRLLAHTNARMATVLDTQLTIRHQESLPCPSDAQFVPRGDLIAFGDWSAGVVLAWRSQGSA